MDYFLHEFGSIEIAERFVASVEGTLENLVAHPELGPRCWGRLEGYRRMSIAGFDKHMLFYIPCEVGIELVRVLHGARDIERIFEDV